MSLPKLYDGLLNDTGRKDVFFPPWNYPYRMAVRSNNPNLLQNPTCLPINPNSVQVTEMSPTRQDYLTAGGITSAHGIPRPGVLVLAGDTGTLGMFVFEALLDFYGRTKEEFLFYNRNIQISWGGVVFTGSFDNMNHTTALPTPINKAWQLQFTFTKRAGRFNSPIPNKITNPISNKIQEKVFGLLS